MIRVEFDRELVVGDASPGDLLLQLSLDRGLPHANACGGQARCSTCRVRVVRGAEGLTPRTSAEELLAQRRSFPDDIRLACQARVIGPVTCRRLVRDDVDAEVLLRQTTGAPGIETAGVVLFSDLRGFTPFAARSLPYDVVHLLNRYFHAMGDLVMRGGGRIDKYLGDGLLAFFQAPEGQERLTCYRAVSTALEMLEALEGLNDYLCEHFNERWQIGIGLHFGNVILGEIGHPQMTQLTILGDAVNVASRIEGATKRLGSPLLVSREVYQRVGPHLECSAEHRVQLRGRKERFRLYAVSGLRSHPDGMPGPACTEVRDRDHIEAALRTTVRRETAPGFLRLAYHDAAAYDPLTGRGGANGSIRLPEELARYENRGLSRMIRLLEPAKATLPRESWADVIAVAGAMAVQVAGGPHIPLELGRMDSDEPSPEGCLPPEGLSVRELRHSFAALDLTLEDLVALSGAHTLGRARGIPLTDDLFTFNNGYFRSLLLNGEPRDRLLATDRALLDDPETYALVLLYALDQDAFFRQFRESYRRLTRLRFPHRLSGSTG